MKMKGLQVCAFLAMHFKVHLKLVGMQSILNILLFHATVALVVADVVAWPGCPFAHFIDVHHGEGVFNGAGCTQSPPL